MNYENDIEDLILILIKCFLILTIFGLLLPELADYFLYYLYKNNIYDNSIFVNLIVDKNSKFIYNYIYILKTLLGIY